jgi:trehalose 6-phosphate synthase
MRGSLGWPGSRGAQGTRRGGRPNGLGRRRPYAGFCSPRCGGRPSVWDDDCSPPRAAYPGRRRATAFVPAWPCSGWGMPGHDGHPPCRWSLTPPFHPYDRWSRSRSAFCCACRGSLRLGVTQHPALRSPDVPRHGHPCRGRLHRLLPRHRSVPGANLPVARPSAWDRGGLGSLRSAAGQGDIVRTLNGRQVVIVANRLPVTHTADGWRASAGGLVTALRPVVQEVDGHWVGWDGGDPNVPLRVDGFDARPASGCDVRRRSPRPLRGLLQPDALAAVSRPAAGTGHRPGLVAGARSRQPAVRSGRRIVGSRRSRLLGAGLPPHAGPRHASRPATDRIHRVLPPHPLPPTGTVARLPWRDRILEGLLGADSLGFHTEWYRENFVRSVRQSRRDVTISGRHDLPARRTGGPHAGAPDLHRRRRLRRPGHPKRNRTGTQGPARTVRGPAGVPGRRPPGLHQGHPAPPAGHPATAGRQPRPAERFVFVQVAVPSREDVEEYQELRDQVEQIVGNINGRFTEPGHDVPVHYLHRSIPGIGWRPTTGWPTSCA